MADGSKKSGARPFFRGGNLREFCTRALHTCAVSRRKLAYLTGKGYVSKLRLELESIFSL